MTGLIGRLLVKSGHPVPKGVQAGVALGEGKVVADRLSVRERPGRHGQHYTVRTRPATAERIVKI